MSRLVIPRHREHQYAADKVHTYSRSGYLANATVKIEFSPALAPRKVGRRTMQAAEHRSCVFMFAIHAAHSFAIPPTSGRGK